MMTQNTLARNEIMWTGKPSQGSRRMKSRFLLAAIMGFVVVAMVGLLGCTRLDEGYLNIVRRQKGS